MNNTTDKQMEQPKSGGITPAIAFAFGFGIGIGSAIVTLITNLLTH